MGAAQFDSRTSMASRDFGCVEARPDVGHDGLARRTCGKFAQTKGCLAMRPKIAAAMRRLDASHARVEGARRSVEKATRKPRCRVLARHDLSAGAVIRWRPSKCPTGRVVFDTGWIKVASP